MGPSPGDCQHTLETLNCAKKTPHQGSHCWYSLIWGLWSGEGKAKSPQALEEGDCWDLLLSPFWPHISDPKCKGHGSLCKLSPLQLSRALDVAVEEMGKGTPLESQGCVGAHENVYEREQERKQTTSPCKAK